MSLSSVSIENPSICLQAALVPINTSNTEASYNDSGNLFFFSVTKNSRHLLLSLYSG